MIYILIIACMLFGFQPSYAMEQETKCQPTRQRATSDLQIKVYTKQERERSRNKRETSYNSRNRAASADEARAGHKKQFTELFGQFLSPEQEKKVSESNQSSLDYQGTFPSTPNRYKNKPVKFKKQPKPQSCCVVQ